jgi:hypothetical protein
MAKVIQMTVSDDLIKMKLNKAFTEWVSSNEKISHLVNDHSRLIVYRENGQIDVSLIQFPDAYVHKYFTDDRQGFCNGMIKSLEQLIFQVLSSIAIRDYKFYFNFNFVGVQVGKSVNYYLLTRIQ